MGFDVVNVAGGRHDYPFMPRFHNPHFKGLRIQVTSADEIVEEEYVVESKYADLISIATACERYADKDHWSFFVNDKIVAETIYTKDLPEGLQLYACIPLQQGDRLRFRFTNSSLSSKAVYVNYHMLDR